MEAGILGKTSLRATVATAMFTAGVSEKVIQENTGHLSVDGLRCYAKTSAEQNVAVWGHLPPRLTCLSRLL